MFVGDGSLGPPSPDGQALERESTELNTHWWEAQVARLKCQVRVNMYCQRPNHRKKNGRFGVHEKFRTALQADQSMKHEAMRHAVFGRFLVWAAMVNDLMVMWSFWNLSFRQSFHAVLRKFDAVPQVLAEMRAERLSILSTVEELQAEAGSGLS